MEPEENHEVETSPQVSEGSPLKTYIWTVSISQTIQLDDDLIGLAEGSTFEASPNHPWVKNCLRKKYIKEHD